MENSSEVAALVAEQIRIIGKKQMEIAEEAGFDNPNVITMIKQGRTKLPLAKVGSMAKALELDPIFLLKLCIKEYQPDTWEAISPLLEEMPTSDEMKILVAVRNWAGGPYLSALTIEQRERFEDFLASMKKYSTTIQ